MDSRLPQPPKLRSSQGFLNIIIGPVLFVGVLVRQVVPGPQKYVKKWPLWLLLWV